MKLAGIFASLPTPFDYRGDLYMAKVRHNVEKWNHTKLAGYVVGGWAGEGVLLSCEERARLWAAVREAAGPPVERLLVAGLGFGGVREMVRLANSAADLGYHAAVLSAPYYYKGRALGSASQTVYVRAVADQSRIPILISHEPQAGAGLPVQALADLAAHPNIVAVVECSGDAEKIAQLVRESPPEFQVLTGAASTLAASLAGGAAGAALDFAAAAPYACLSIYEAVRTREHEAAQDLQRRLAPAISALAEHGVPGLKYAMDLNGYYGGPPRLPLLPPSAEAKGEIEAAFRELKG